MFRTVFVVLILGLLSFGVSSVENRVLWWLISITIVLSLFPFMRKQKKLAASPRSSGGCI